MAQLELKQKATDAVEQNGIVFIDEIDKICKKGEYSGADVSREGVQRDLLPLVEGSTVNTKHGMVKTDHILFIASMAFCFNSSELINLAASSSIKVFNASLIFILRFLVLSEPRLWNMDCN